MLVSAYKNSLARAEELGLRSVAFPLSVRAPTGIRLRRRHVWPWIRLFKHLRAGSGVKQVIFVLFSERTLRL